MVLNTAYFAYYNVGLIVLAILILFMAYRKGFVRQLMDVSTYFGSLLLAVLLSPKLADLFPLVPVNAQNEILRMLDSVALHIMDIFLWFLIVFIGLRVIYRILTLVFHHRKKTSLSLVNHLAGLGLGIIKVLLLGMTLSLVLRFPLIRYGDEFVTHSVLSFMDPIQETLMEYWEG